MMSVIVAIRELSVFVTGKFLFYSVMFCVERGFTFPLRERGECESFLRVYYVKNPPSRVGKGVCVFIHLAAKSRPLGRASS